jgi:hypothetical protein
MLAGILRGAQVRAPQDDGGVCGVNENGRRHCCRRPSFIEAGAYFGYLNSGAAFKASLVVFIVASHLLFLVSYLTLTDDGDTAT